VYRYVSVCVAVEIHCVRREAGQQAIFARLDDALVLRDMDVSASFAALVFEGGRTFCEAAGTDACTRRCLFICVSWCSVLVLFLFFPSAGRVGGAPHNLTWLECRAGHLSVCPTCHQVFALQRRQATTPS